MVLSHIQGFGLYPINYVQPQKDFNRESRLTRLKFHGDHLGCHRKEDRSK